jgi:hypothetical protein
MGMTRPASPAVDDWEIDITQLQIDAKVDEDGVATSRDPALRTAGVAGRDIQCLACLACTHWAVCVCMCLQVASGAFSNLYRGSYCGQEVAVKILKDVQDDTSQYSEFLQVQPGMREEYARGKHIVAGISRGLHVSEASCNSLRTAHGFART